MSEAQEEHWTAVEEAAELLGTGDVQGAIAELTRITAAQSDNEYAFYFLGNAYFEDRQYPKALKCYVRALELAPEYLGAMVGGGQTLRMMGEYVRAIRMGQRILGLAKDDPDGLYLLGLAHFQRGDSKLADGFLQRFLETSPELEVASEVDAILQSIREEAVPSPEGGDTLEQD